VRSARLWRQLLGVQGAVVERVEFDPETDTLVAHVRPGKGASKRCGRCGRRAGWYDRGEGRRQWRALDLGVARAVVEADAPRVDCPEHGPTVISVPWAPAPGRAYPRV
jgi:transposase